MQDDDDFVRAEPTTNEIIDTTVNRKTSSFLLIKSHAEIEEQKRRLKAEICKKCDEVKLFHTAIKDKE